jgi:hypothetical protein|tara:strand:+ start:1045 stop:1359 length:315 start_codon:yes stop_codon:yes gene_type:complete
MDDLTVGNSLNIGQIVADYGFPIIAAAAMGYFIYFIWTWVSTKVDPVIGDSHMTLIALIDRVRMLDNDLIRLNAKLDMILQERERNEAINNSTVTKPKPDKPGK